MRKPEVTKGCCVPKGWGEEIVIENNEMYGFKKECKTLRQYAEAEGNMFNKFINHLSALEDGQEKVNGIKPNSTELPGYQI